MELSIGDENCSLPLCAYLAAFCKPDHIIMTAWCYNLCDYMYVCGTNIFLYTLDQLVYLFWLSVGAIYMGIIVSRSYKWFAAIDYGKFDYGDRFDGFLG